MGSVPSGLYWRRSPLLALITKFARDPPAQNPLLTRLQEAVAIRNKIEILLSRMVTLEGFFTTLPGDVEEQRRRLELIRYIFIRPFRPTVELRPASSTVLGDNCGRCTGSQGWSNLLNTPRAMRVCSGFSKIYKRPSPTIRFVRNLALFSMLTRGTDRATNDDLRPRV